MRQWEFPPGREAFYFRELLPVWTDNAELAGVFQGTLLSPETEGWIREVFRGWYPSLLFSRAEGTLSSVWRCGHCWVDLALYPVKINLRTTSPSWFSLPRNKHFLNFRIVSVFSSPFLCTVLFPHTPTKRGPLLSHIMLYAHTAFLPLIFTVIRAFSSLTFFTPTPRVLLSVWITIGMSASQTWLFIALHTLHVIWWTIYNTYHFSYPSSLWIWNLHKGYLFWGTEKEAYANHICPSKAEIKGQVESRDQSLIQ